MRAISGRLSRTLSAHEGLDNGNGEGTAVEFVTSRITKVIFHNEIPTPEGHHHHRSPQYVRCACASCFELDEESEKRIEVVCQAGSDRPLPSPRRWPTTLPARCFAVPHLTKKIPAVPLAQVAVQPTSFATATCPALFADIAQEYGPVFEIRPPFKPPMIFLARARDEPLDEQARAHVPESQGLLFRLREDLRREWRIALPGWRRSFPAPQVPGASVFPRQTGGATGPAIRSCPESTWRIGQSGTPCLPRACAGE